MQNSFSYSIEMRSAAAVVQGANISASTSIAPSKDRWPSALVPVMLASTAPAPKIKTGIQSGKTSKDTSTPPPRKPSVKAAPTAPIKLKTGVPKRSDATSVSKCLRRQIELHAQAPARSVPAALPSPASARLFCPARPPRAAAASTSTARDCRPRSRARTCGQARASRPAAPRPRRHRARWSRRTFISGPTPSGNRLTTMMKKKSVDSTPARPRHARVTSL